jgi:murein DD-endopeptidase MepM/ murein hydrolase activator NlpD
VLRFALSLLVLLLVAPAAQAGSWRRPVDGSLLRGFAVGRDAYVRGQHRGVDLAAPRGSPVRSACAGPVSFAGRVPRGGLTVSVRCGAVVATYQQLGSIAVRARAAVARGARLGSVGVSSDPREHRAHVHLGARAVATGRYLDPLTLLADGPPASPLLPPVTRTAPRPAPLGPAPGSPRAAPARPLPGSPRAAPARPLPVSPRAAPARPLPVSPWAAPASPRADPASRLPASPRAAPASPLPAWPRADSRGLQPGLPWSVWVGLACVGLGLPVGGFMRLRRRRHASSRVAQTA